MEIAAIKPGLVSRRCLRSESKVSRIELVKQKEQQLIAKHNAIIARGDVKLQDLSFSLPTFSGQNQEKPFPVENGVEGRNGSDPHGSETGSEISHATSERDLHDIDMTEGDSEDASWG